MFAGLAKNVPVNTRVSPEGGFPPLFVTEKVFWTCSYAVTEIELNEAVYEDEVAEKALDTIKPSRVLPLLEKDRVKEAPANMVIVCELPSAAKVLGLGLPPFTITVVLGAELLMVTVMLWDTVFTV